MFLPKKITSLAILLAATPAVAQEAPADAKGPAELLSEKKVSLNFNDLKPLFQDMPL